MAGKVENGVFKVNSNNVGTLNNMVQRELSRMGSNAPTRTYTSNDWQNKNPFYQVGQTVNVPTVDPTKTPTGDGSKSSNSSANAQYLNGIMSAYMSQRQNQMNEALDKARSAVEGGYNEAAGLLGKNYDSAVGALGAQYDNGMRTIKNDALQSLKEAYINKMKTLRDMPQRMSALGLNGGMSESNLASAYNNYGNARANINMNTNNNIANLDADRADRLAQILQNYNNGLASLAQQRASALAQIEQSAMNGALDMLDKQFTFQTSTPYMNAMQKALETSNFAPTVADATNGVNPASINQADMSQLFGNTNYEELLKLLEQYYQR